VIDIARRENSCTVFREYTRVCVLDYCECIEEHQRMTVNYTEAKHFEFTTRRLQHLVTVSTPPFFCY